MPDAPNPAAGSWSATDEFLRQATCAVIVDGKVRGTAWLLNREGLLLTAGHVLGETNPVEQVQVRFPEDVPRDAYKIVWSYQKEAGVDFAVLKTAEIPKNRQPLPISLEREPSGEFFLRGYGRSLQDQSSGRGEIVGTYDPQNQPALRLMRLRSPEIGEPGYSGGAVFLEASRAVVGVQIEAAVAKTGAGRDTVLAMPLYRIAKIWEPLAIVSTGQSVVSVQSAAALTPLLAHEHQEAGRLPRFVLRNEVFGSLVFDRERGDYIPFDVDATDIFRSRNEPLESIKERMSDRLEPGNFDTFIQLCQSIELVDQDGKFTGQILGNVASQAHLSAPKRVHLSCTRACNFSCRHCYSSSGNPYPDELTTEEIKRLIDQMADMGCLDLWLGGGEPLVRADLPDIIGHANTRGVLVGISTNAVAATPSVVRALRGTQINCFKISMEGASEAVYDDVRGETGAFQEALRGIGNLRELGAPIYLHRVFMTPNASELRALIRLADQLGVGKVVLDSVMAVGRAAEHPDLILTASETNRLWDDATAMQNGTQVKIEIPRQVPFKWGTKAPWGGFGCSCGSEICHIDPRGNVAPTGFLRDVKSAGNIRQQSLKRIWDLGSSFIEFRTLNGNTKCNPCSFFKQCRGGCRARTLVDGQNINLPDTDCLVAVDPVEEDLVQEDSAAEVSEAEVSEAEVSAAEVSAAEDSAAG
jgi:radical SAM protein with 4Fe4S-binding SPASM domain